MGNQHTDYAESLFGAIDKIVTQRISDIKFDSTIVCTIVNDADSKNGHYIVTDGSIRFDAYSEVDSYRVDDMVRVSVLNGDTTQKKYIEGKYVADNDSNPITYVSPLDTVLDMSDNLMALDNQDSSAIWGLNANGAKKEWCLWSHQFSASDPVNVQKNSLYDTVFVRGEFKTLLSQYRMKTGNFGLRLDIYEAPVSGSSMYVRKQLFLDSGDMFGNPYSFSVYSTQAAAGYIGASGNIKVISLYLYQLDNFKYFSGKEVLRIDPTNGTGVEKDWCDILVKNVYVGLGADLTKIDDNTLKLYTEDSSLYNTEDNVASHNTKTMSLLWYNKDELNRYIGFSDGIKDDNYDEIDYLMAKTTDLRKSSQQGKNVPNTEEALDMSADISEAAAIADNISTTISKDLYSEVLFYRDALSSLGLTSNFTNITNNINTQGYVVDSNWSLLKQYYIGMLEDAYNKWQGIEATVSFDKLSSKDPRQNILDAIDAMIDVVVSEVTGTDAKITAAVKKDYAGFMATVDTYTIRIEKVITLLQDYRDAFAELIDSNYKTKLTTIVNTASSITLEDEYTEKPLENCDNRYCIYWYRYEPEYYDPEEPFMEKEWRRLTPEETGRRNLGLPTQSETSEEDGLTYYIKRPIEGEGNLTRLMDVNYKEEKYVVVLFYNHERYQSEPLVFTNQRPKVDASIKELTNGIYIEHGDGSQEAYQLYGINNYLINAADGYRQRHLRLRYNSEIGDEDTLIGSQIFWYLPINATMLTHHAEDLYDADDEYPFTHDISEHDNESDEGVAHSEFYRPGYYCFYKTIRAGEDGHINSEDRYFIYRISNYYSPSFTNNTIKCVIKSGADRTLEAEIAMAFSGFGTSGTDYTLAVVPDGVVAAVQPNAPLILDISLYNYDNQEIELYSSGTKPYLSSASWVGPHTDSIDIGTYVVDNLITKAAVSGSSGYNVLRVDVLIALEGERNVNLTTFYPVAYATDNYYIEGANFVVYDSTGANPAYYKQPYRLFKRGTDEEIAANWSIIYYDKNGTKLDLTDLPAFMASYAPVLTSNNELKPSVMYLASVDEDGAVKEVDDFYAVVEARVNDGLAWSQPIHIMQNRYPSPMLNAWDGSLTIDEKNGTILSTMVGAGRKNINNQFEGVLMGDVGVGAEMQDNSAGIGIYGFHDGAQSFNLNIDGTAFFGKSGRGRIKIDGNSGTISSASWEQQKLAYGLQDDDKYSRPFDSGMMIDLDDGQIEMRSASRIVYKDDDGNEVIGYGIAIPEDVEHIENNNSYVRLSTQAPYFRIDSQFKDQSKPDNKHTLMFVGDAYPRQYDETGNEILDSTGNVAIDITDDSYNADTQGYYLQSDNYQKGGVSGMRIDLERGHIDAHNFNLTSGYLTMNSLGTKDFPYLNIFTDVIDDDGIEVKKDLLKISNEEFLMQSVNFAYPTVSNAGAGMKLDIQNGIIVAYDGLTIQAYAKKDADMKNKFIIIDTEAGTDFNANIYPLQVGNKFKVGWDGVIETYGAIIGEGAHIGDWYVGKATLVTKKASEDLDIIMSDPNASGGPVIFLSPEGVPVDVVNADGSINTTKTALIKVGDHFAVTNEGWVYATKFVLHQGTIVLDDDAIIQPGISIDEEGNLSGSNVNLRGIINAEGGRIGNWVIKTGLHTVIPPGATQPEIFLHPEGMDATLTKYADPNKDKSEEIKTLVFRAGKKFGVAPDGTLYATDAYFSGAVNAYAGNIGNWYIGAAYSTQNGNTKIADIIYSKEQLTTSVDTSYVDIVHDNETIQMPTIFLSPQGLPYKIFFAKENSTQNAGDYAAPEKSSVDVNLLIKIGECFGVDTNGEVYAKKFNIINGMEPNGELNPGQFYLQSNGNLIACGVNIKGTITAEAGHIGNWNIARDQNGDEFDGLIDDDRTIFLTPTGKTATLFSGSSAVTTSLVFKAGSNFGVTPAGKLYASGASIKGHIEATSGTIGKCEIDADGNLQVPSANITGTLTADKIIVYKDSNKNIILFKADSDSYVVTIGSFKVDSNSLYSSAGSWTAGGGGPTVFLSTGTNTSLSIGGADSQTNWAIGVNGKFGVTTSGKLYASDAIISGDISASSGDIGGFTINTNGIFSNKHTVSTTVYYVSSARGKKPSASSSSCTLKFYVSSTVYNLFKNEQLDGRDLVTLTKLESLSASAAQFGQLFPDSDSNGYYFYCSADVDVNSEEDYWIIYATMTLPYTTTKSDYILAIDKTNGLTATSGQIGGWTIGMSSLISSMAFSSSEQLYRRIILSNESIAIEYFDTSSPSASATPKKIKSVSWEALLKSSSIT